MEQHANRTVFLGRLDDRIAHLAAVTAMKILWATLTLCILGWASTAQAAIPASQRTVLTNLYSATNGASWTNQTNWNGAVGTECTWFGISCDATQSNVVAINLFQNNLAGTLPALSGLPALQAFNAYNNQLSGPIPALSGLTALKNFNANNSVQLNGSIPSLSGLTALQSFGAGNNKLTVSIP